MITRDSLTSVVRKQLHDTIFLRVKTYVYKKLYFPQKSILFLSFVSCKLVLNRSDNLCSALVVLVHVPNPILLAGFDIIIIVVSPIFISSKLYSVPHSRY